jgi:prepilin-type N-terminal cleavage/methylation domain-containing protein
MAGGFTLVELLTVMGILAILVALVVGAAQSISQHGAHVETRQTLEGIAAGLTRYFDDWGKFPWYTNNPPNPLLGTVYGVGNPTARPTYCPVPPQYERKADVPAAMLHACMTMNERNGPYYTGSAGNVDTFPVTDATDYQAFVDGWGRPIHYFEPHRKEGTNEVAKFPLLMSEGPIKDAPSLAETWEDNIFNYPVNEADRPKAGADYFP